MSRGFETFARECFEALHARPELEVTLVKGAGPSSADDVTRPTLRREAGPARALARALRRDPYWVECVVFSLAMLPLVWRRRPDVVFTSDWWLGRALGRLRDLARTPFKLLLSNGIPAPPPFEPFDHVQQFTAPAYERVLELGEPRERHTLLPLAFAIPRSYEPPSDDERAGLRRALGLPLDRRVLLSVAALNRWHKRIDYVIEEVASLPEPRPFLALLGEPEDETPALLRRADERLGPRGYLARTVPPPAIGEWYRAADALILASTTEAMGRAFVEALAQGLPAIGHAYPLTQFVLGEHGITADLRRRGELSRLVAALDDDQLAAERRRVRHRYAYERFSWDVLAPRYVEMVRACAAA